MGQRLNRLVLQTNKDLQDIFERVANQVGTAELVEVVTHDLGDRRVILAVFEKYFFRVGSYVSATLLLTAQEGQLVADVIGSGGGEGLFNISWGANSDFAFSVTEALRAEGFELIQVVE